MNYNKAISSNIWFKKQKYVLVSLLLSIKKQVFLVYGMFFLSSLFLVCVYNKFSLHLYINQFHTSFLDLFFKYTTHLGDGIMFGVLVLFFFIIKKRMALVFLISGIVTLLVTHFFKKIIFKGIPRPVEALGEESLYLIKGIKIAYWNTFPSGHTITAFAIFTILCLYFRKSTWQYLWLALALVAGVSRVYLSQHFWIDIFVGSTLGIVIGFVSMGLVYSERKRVKLMQVCHIKVLAIGIIVSRDCVETFLGGEFRIWK